MGIKNLMKLLKDEAPTAIKDTKLINYNGKLVAIDASTQLYQYFVMIKQSDDKGNQHYLTSSSGNPTSHIQGFFNRTIKLIEMGIKPVYVFDGDPPEFKMEEIEKRRDAKNKAKDEIDELKNELKNCDSDQDGYNKSQIIEQMNKLQKRTVRVTKEHNEQVKKLLRFMGVPVIESPGEAEAQCAELCKSGKVYAVATDDMDALTFNTPILIRHFTFSNTKNKAVHEIRIENLLKELKLTYQQFVDLSILCGCDYCPSIKGIGPKKAYDLIKTHKYLEDVFKHIQAKTKYTIPEQLLERYNDIRELFYNPNVIKGELFTKDLKIKFKEPDINSLKKYLIEELNFNEERVLSSISRLTNKNTELNLTQRSLDNFFKVK